MRPLLTAVVLLCATRAALAKPAPTHGAWGEELRVTPDFAPTEERRAPKVPDGGKLWKEFHTSRTLSAVKDALLVCHVMAGSRDTAGRVGLGILTLGLSEAFHDNLTLRLRVRGEPTIVLWGPRNHDDAFVSIPALDLAAGDALELALADRGMFSTKPLGRARLKWDGSSPLVFVGKKWRVDCVVMTSEETHARVQPLLASLDRQLETLAQAPFDRTRESFGATLGIVGQLESSLRVLTREWNFRYAAGFVGWGDPEIQSRIARMNGYLETFNAKAREAVREIHESATREPLIIEGVTVKLGTLRKGTLPAEVECATEEACEKPLLLSLVDDNGRFHSLLNKPPAVKPAGKGAAPLTPHPCGEGKLCSERLFALPELVTTSAPARLVFAPGGEYRRVD